MSTESGFVSLFDEVYDVVVFGVGYAGFAAARAAAEAGKRVLAVDLRGDVLWESGRAFISETGESEDEAWNAWRREVERVDGCGHGRIDGAIAEVVGNEAFMKSNPVALYYAMPVAVEMQDAKLAAVIVATKAGLRRVLGRQWIDATEAATLARLIDSEVAPRQPDRRQALLYLQQATWPKQEAEELEVPDLADCRVTWEPTMWINQRCLRMDMPGDAVRFRHRFRPVLERAREALGDQIKSGYVSHVSLESYPVYEAATAAPQGPDVPNVAYAVPGFVQGPIKTLAERYTLGNRAARRLLSQAACEPEEALREKAIEAPEPRRTRTCDVAVMGAGTAGALAALAAGYENADTVVVEPLSFPGGIGTGGNIPSYYWGVTGGLQEEVDARLGGVMPLFATRDVWVRGFHPDAKAAVLEMLMAESGAEIWYGSMLADVNVEDGWVRSALIATPTGPVRIEAPGWIDCTGDGDLAAWAGASFQFGRDRDHVLHAYTQSCGRLGLHEERIRHQGLNYDAGFVDPTDSQDMTRGRIEAIHQHLKPRYDQLDRPTFIAAQLGLRQGRQIDTDYVITMNDELLRRRFDDCIALHGCYADNHATDNEFESDEGVIYFYGFMLRTANMACEIPYRALLPKGLQNVWVACRALGVTQDAHYSLRMQRDMQRIGEAAGIAAALAARNDCGSREIPFEKLRARLEERDALSVPDQAETEFGAVITTERWSDPYAELSEDDRIERCLSDLKEPEFGIHLWHLYQAGGDKAGDRVAELLDAEDDTVSFKAALVLASWGDARCEPRLVGAIESGEEGEEFDAVKDDLGQRQRNRVLPRWWRGAVMLGFGGTPNCLPALGELTERQELAHDARASIALTCEKLAVRCQLDTDQRAQVERILDKLLAQEPESVVLYPAHDPVSAKDPRSTWGKGWPQVDEELRWQLDFAVARARKAIDVPPHPSAQRWMRDRRAHVRNAFARLYSGEL